MLHPFIILTHSMYVKLYFVPEPGLDEAMYLSSCRHSPDRELNKSLIITGFVQYFSPSYAYI